MPDPYERHARSSENDWGGNAPRSASRRAAASDETVKRPPGKKDPDLCKALHWKGPHVPEFRLREHGWRSKSCGWTTEWALKGPHWACGHEEVCSGCGKVLEAFPGRRCPDYREITDSERTEIEEKIRQWEQRRRRPFRSRIDGPQGYRKPKKEKDA